MTHQNKIKINRIKNITYRIFTLLIYILIILFFAWFAFSIIEVWIHNGTMFNEKPYEYSNLNMFLWLLRNK